MGDKHHAELLSASGSPFTPLKRNGDGIKPPRVSVCMPTYNYGRFLPEAIESVLRQTYQDYEFIIIDDGSRDNSEEIIRRYAGRDARIHSRVNDVNVGMVNNWNACLALARGEYIKFLFGDDMFASEHALQKWVTVLDSDEEIALVASSKYRIDETSRVMGVVSKYKRNLKCRGPLIIKDCLLEQRNKIGEPSLVMFRRNIPRPAFDTRYKQLVDLEMWFSILEQGSFAFLDEPLCAFRIHPGQQSEKNVRQFVHLDEHLLLVSEYTQKTTMHFSRFQTAYLRYASLYTMWRQLYKENRVISRQAALKDISSRYSYGVVLFFAWYPIYELYKQYIKLKNACALARDKIVQGMRSLVLQPSK